MKIERHYENRISREFHFRRIQTHPHERCSQSENVFQRKQHPTKLGPPLVPRWGSDFVDSNSILQGEFGVCASGLSKTDLLKLWNITACLGLILHDANHGIGAAAHLDIASDPAECLAQMIEMLHRTGVQDPDLTSFVIGGETGHSEALVQRTMQCLDECAIPLSYQDTLGDRSRNFIFNVKEGSLKLFHPFLFEQPFWRRQRSFHRVRSGLPVMFNFDSFGFLPWMNEKVTRSPDLRSTLPIKLETVSPTYGRNERWYIQEFEALPKRRNLAAVFDSQHYDQTKDIAIEIGSGMSPAISRGFIYDRDFGEYGEGFVQMGRSWEDFQSDLLAGQFPKGRKFVTFYESLPFIFTDSDSDLSRFFGTLKGILESLQPEDLVVVFHRKEHPFALFELTQHLRYGGRPFEVHGVPGTEDVHSFYRKSTPWLAAVLEMQ